MIQPVREGSSAFRTLVLEAVTLLLAFVVGMVLVTLFSFAPPTIHPTGQVLNLDVTAYLDAVRSYWLGLLQGNLGQTATRRSVTNVLLPAAGRSAVLLGVSLTTAIALGLVWGALLATIRRQVWRLLLFGLNSLLLSLPTFAVLILLMQAVARVTMQTGIQLAYVMDYGLDRHLILPTTVLALRGGAYLARSFQVAHEDILHQDWIRTARAKGLGGWQLWWRHVLPALRLPLVGGILGALRVMTSALIIVEYLTLWGGLGSLMLSVGRAGVRPTEGSVTAGAAGLLVLFFILTDGLGRLIVWLERRRTG